MQTHTNSLKLTQTLLAQNESGDNQISVTEMEVWHGALNDLDAARQHAQFYFKENKDTTTKGA